MRRALGVAIFVGSAAFLVAAFVRTYHKVDFDLDVGLSIAAVALIACAIAASALVWRILVVGSGVDLPASESVRIVALSQLGKYIPGGIWQPLGQVGLARRAGVGVALASVTAAIFMVLTAAGALVAGPVLLALSHAAGAFVWLLALAPASMVVVHPAVIRRCLKLAARAARRPVPDIADVSPALVARAFAAILPVWLLYGTSVWLGARAIGLADAGDWTLISGAFAIAWVIGFLALPVPGGLGIREAILLLILGAKFPSSDAIAIAVTSRMFFIAAEGALAGLSALIPHRPVPSPASGPA
jgi:glycosyltransferase 2 family protein